jgi:uncharacterized protein
MKKLSLIAIFLIATISVLAATYSVDNVPNTHIADRSQFVSNPDGLLSATAVAQLNTTLKAIADSTSAEVVVVALSDIDSDIDRFATDLFSTWGLGKKDNNNGALVLIVADQQQAVIRTGYGMESTLPDILCGRILRDVMFPRFKEGNYDAGTVNAVTLLSSAIMDPEAREHIMSKYANDDDADDEKDIFLLYAIFACLITTGSIITTGYQIVSTRHMERFERYQKLDKLSTPILFLTFLALGAPLIAYIPLRLLLKKLRRGKRKCPNCGQVMVLVDEENDNKYLTPAQDTEERINSVDYDVWICPQCRETDILPYRNKSTTYTECPICHSIACSLQCDRIILQPTTTHKGYGIKEYDCLNCHNRTQQRYDIAKLATPIIIAGGGGGFSGGGGISGGSFGGGMTGGGGARGGW